MPLQPKIEVCLSPVMLPLYDLSDKIVVVIDILRATSTIGVALEHGALSVIPVANVEDCQQYEGEGYLLAGERGGAKVEGFKYGNSPFEYMNGAVKGKDLVLTTTNGTRSIMLSKDAHRIIAGSFLNLDRVCEWLSSQQRDVMLFCAGWKNKFNLEDTLYAGAVAWQLSDKFEMACDASLAARHLYDCSRSDLLGTMKQASHYKRLAGFGIQQDIAYCLTPNQINVIPVYSDGRMTSLVE